MDSTHKLQTFFLVLTFNVFLIVESREQRVKYTGYEVHRFVPNTEEELLIMKDLETTNPGVIFFRQPGNMGSAVDLAFPPHLQTDLLDALNEKMPSSLISDDIESMLDHDSHVAQLEALDEGEFPFTAYWNFAKYLKFLKNLETLHPDMCKIEQYGTSFEGRPLLAMVVSSSHPAPADKPAMFVDGGTHAREWVTVMSCAYFLNDMVSKKEEYQHILDSFVVIFMCCVNPDGFVYSWARDRLWRKNRQPNSGPGGALSPCVGVDPNRNYGAGHKGVGSSTDPCAETYCGPFPFSISETKNLTDYARTKNGVSFVTLHSYSQLILLSFGCRSFFPDRYRGFENDLSFANKAAAALKAISGTEYQCGNSNEILYEACGNSADWFLGIYKTRYAYTYELRDQGTFGFMLPQDQLLACAEETTASLKLLHENMATQILAEQKEEEFSAAK